MLKLRTNITEILGYRGEAARWIRLSSYGNSQSSSTSIHIPDQCDRISGDRDEPVELGIKRSDPVCVFSVGSSNRGRIAGGSGEPGSGGDADQHFICVDRDDGNEFGGNATDSLRDDSVAMLAGVARAEPADFDVFQCGEHRDGDVGGVLGVPASEFAIKLGEYAGEIDCGSGGVLCI